MIQQTSTAKGRFCLFNKEVKHVEKGVNLLQAKNQILSILLNKKVRERAGSDYFENAALAVVAVCQGFNLDNISDT